MRTFMVGASGQSGTDPWSALPGDVGGIGPPKQHVWHADPVRPIRREQQPDGAAHGIALASLDLGRDDAATALVMEAADATGVVWCRWRRSMCQQNLQTSLPWVTGTIA